MQYNKILKAYAPMQHMMKIKLPIRENKKSRQIYKMALEMESIVEYIKQEEMKIIQKYNGEIQPSGTIFFGSDEDGVHRARLCASEIDAFETSDAEWDYKIITLSEESLMDDSGFALSPEEIFYLEGFVEFED
jgi:hypothetical protein